MLSTELHCQPHPSICLPNLPTVVTWWGDIPFPAQCPSTSPPSPTRAQAGDAGAGGPILDKQKGATPAPKNQLP